MNEDMNIQQAKEEGRFRVVAVPVMILADVFKGGCFFKGGGKKVKDLIVPVATKRKRKDD